jgi:PAS domain-containing protein
MIYQKNKVKSAQTVPACPALLLALSPIESHSLESRLRSVGFDSLYVPLSTEEAITLSEQGQPDLVVMDIDFGGPLAGIETGGILHEKLDVPVLYAARESQVDALSPILAAGGMGLLIDRLDLLTLRTTVQLLINQARIAKESQWRERRLLSLLASVGDAVLTVDRELNITFMNHQAEHITGAQNSFLRGKERRDTMMSTRCQRCECTITEAMADALFLGLENEFESGTYSCCEIVVWAAEQWGVWTEATIAELSRPEADRRRTLTRALG